MRKSYIVFALLILLSIVIGALLYPAMPSDMASHWDYRGRVNSYVPKFWGLFFFPLISSILLVMFHLIPKLDPMAHNIEEFRNHYDNFTLLMGLFLFYIHIITIFWNLGARLDINRLISPAFAIILFYCGIMLYHAKRNWSIGIRTPWTLSSDYIWDQTHRLGGMMFTVSGVICLLGVILPVYSIIFIMAPVLSASVILVLYSYLLYRNEKQELEAEAPHPAEQRSAAAKKQPKPKKRSTKKSAPKSKAVTTQAASKKRGAQRKAKQQSTGQKKKVRPKKGIKPKKATKPKPNRRPSKQKKKR